jgi:hypothetical protein
VHIPVKMVYLGASITAGNRSSVEIDNNDRNGSNGHNLDMLRSSSDRDGRDRDGNDSSGDEEREGQIRVGKDYQVGTPNFIPLERKKIGLKSTFWVKG